MEILRIFVKYIQFLFKLLRLTDRKKSYILFLIVFQYNTIQEKGYLEERR